MSRYYAVTFGAPSSAWPDATNTGHVNAPGYPGSLTAWPGGALVDNTTYSYYDFVGNYDVGAVAGPHPVNVTFYGCRFRSNAVDFANIKDYGAGTKFSYCTIMPSAVSAPPVSLANAYQYGILKDSYYAALTVEYCNIWGFGNAFQINGSSQAAPHIIRHNWIHDAADPAGSYYHHDGVLCTVGGANCKYVVIQHNTIESLGNTNAIALQLDGGGPYDHITVVNNKLGGFGYTVQIGGASTGNQFLTFTDNVLNLGVVSEFGPLYNWSNALGNNTWRRNTWLDPTGVDSRSGKFWYPTDELGHVTDYTG